jgi:hypothetical protein
MNSGLGTDNATEGTPVRQCSKLSAFPPHSSSYYHEDDEVTRFTDCPRRGETEYEGGDLKAETHS